MRPDAAGPLDRPSGDDCVFELLKPLLEAAAKRADPAFVVNLVGDALAVWMYVETVKNADAVARILGPERTGIMLAASFWLSMIIVVFCVVQFVILRKLR